MAQGRGSGTHGFKSWEELRRDTHRTPHLLPASQARGWLLWKTNFNQGSCSTLTPQTITMPKGYGVE